MSASDAAGAPAPTAAAFFDVDNTMMVGASIFHFARGLATRGVFGWRDVLGFAARQARLRLAGESATDMHRTRDSALAFVAGRDVAEIVALGEEIYDDSMSARIWPGTLAAAKRHREAGHPVWLVTATPVELATIIADRLGLDGALGTVSETSAGRYTGRLVGDVLHGEAKARAVRDLAEREGYDLSACSAYSDSINDVPLLSLVGHPVAVNPDLALRREARQRGWEIRDFRTGRKVARIGVPAALGTGALAGAIAAGLAYRRASAGPGGAEQAIGAARSRSGRAPERSPRTATRGGQRRRDPRRQQQPGRLGISGGSRRYFLLRR